MVTFVTAWFSLLAWAGSQVRRVEDFLSHGKDFWSCFRAAQQTHPSFCQPWVSTHGTGPLEQKHRRQHCRNVDKQTNKDQYSFFEINVLTTIFLHYCHSKVGLWGWGEFSLNNIKCSTLWALTFAFQGSCWSTGRLPWWQKQSWEKEEGLNAFHPKSTDALKQCTFYFMNGCGNILGPLSKLGPNLIMLGATLWEQNVFWSGLESTLDTFP